MTTNPQTISPDRAELLEALAKHRALFRHTADGLTDEQARLRPTASELTLGGLVKHVTAVEAQWARFMTEGPDNTYADVDWAAVDWSNPPEWARAFQDGFRLLPEETLAGVLTAYDEQAARTDELVRTLDLDTRQPLPTAPWFEPGAAWSIRRVVVHLVAETAQHAGHADIIRETIDGQKSMG